MRIPLMVTIGSRAYVFAVSIHELYRGLSTIDYFSNPYVNIKFEPQNKKRVNESRTF